MATVFTENLAKIQSTAGYHKLTAQQQRMIKVSLRFERRHDQSSAWRYSDKYRLTHKVYNGINCHITIYMLEAQRFIGLISNNDIPCDFFEAIYSNDLLTTTNQISEFIACLNFPSVVHISTTPSHTGSHDPVVHTLLALGVHNNSPVLWEKRGWSGEFRVPSTSELIADRPSYYWGSRPLKTCG